MEVKKGFNSNMVRLKELASNSGFGERNMFQFQYGTIKRSINLPKTWVFPCFNSNMVRLKVIVERLIKLIKMFQFQYGTIKRSHRVASCYQHLCFNSNMVRLKVQRRSIKSAKKKVSIPIWYD